MIPAKVNHVIFLVCFNSNHPCDIWEGHLISLNLSFGVCTPIIRYIFPCLPSKIVERIEFDNAHKTIS